MADNENFQAAAFTARGTAREQVTLPETTFDGTVNMPVMHQAVKAFLANQRQANAHTKIRKYVTGGNQKPWKQKGTGRARQGSTRAPNWVGGGTVFGPTNERNYKQAVPRQVRQLARKSALNARARENSIIIIDAFSYDAPKTSRMQALVSSVGAAGRKVLILTDGVKPNVFLSARNLPTVHVMPYSDASTYHILWSDVVLIESSALGQALAPIAGEAEEAVTPSRTKARTSKPAAKAEGNRAAVRSGEKAEKKTAKQAAKKEKAKSVKASAKKAAPKKGAAKKSASAKAPAKKAAAKKPAKSAASAKKSAAKKPAAKKSTKKGS